MKKSLNKFFDLLKSIIIILIVLGFLSMIFGFMVDIFNEADPTPDISIGENDGNGSGGSGGSGSGGSGGSSDNDEPGENENPGGSGGSSGPVDPDIPDDPETPDEPDVPDDPVQPGEPEDPDEPVDPDPEPDPEPPIDPTPDEPDDPDVPDEPDEPINPDPEPDVPVDPDEPDEPINPDPEPDPEPEEHVHTFNGWHVVEEATCTTDGLKQRECIDSNCDYIETDVIVAGHKFNSNYVCTVCGYVDDNHHCELSAWMIIEDSTCSTVGSMYRECECGKVEYATIERKDHTITTWYIDPAPTCESAGVKKGVCTVCGHTEETSVNSLGHSYTGNVCDRCGEVRPHEHEWGEYQIINQATCTAEGLKCATCTSCPEVNEEVIPKVAHDYGDWSITKDETCTEAGSKSRTCKNCSDTQTQTINALGHFYGNDDVCDRCREVRPHEHEWGEYEIINQSTCTAEGLKRRTCTSCPEVNEVSIPKAGHFYSVWIEDKAATCIESGSEHRECKNCGNVQEQNIPAFGHSYDSNNKCTVCGHIPDHVCSLSDWIIEDSSCTEPGTKYKYCTFCNVIKVTEKIPPKGHVFEEDTCIVCGYFECKHVVEEWFTDCELGSEWGYCTKCGDYIEKVTYCRDHEYGADNICVNCQAKKPLYDEYEESFMTSGTDELGNPFDSYYINTYYLQNAQYVQFDYLNVAASDRFPITIHLMGSYNFVKIRVGFTHPVSKDSIVIRTDDGREFFPSYCDEEGYYAEFEIEIPDVFQYEYQITLVDLTEGYNKVAMINGLEIDCYHKIY